MPRLDVRPLLVVVSGASGAGKTTALAWLAEFGGFTRLPTYTTRPPRPVERRGLEYHHVDAAQFGKLFEAGEIVEWTRKYSGHLYGSPAEALRRDDPRPLAIGLDPAGFVRVRSLSERRTVGIFVAARSEAELQRRLAARGTLDPAGERRDQAEQARFAWAYDYLLVNDDLETFLADLATVVRGEMLRSAGAAVLRELLVDVKALPPPAGVSDEHAV